MATTAVKSLDDLVDEIRDAINDNDDPHRFDDTRVMRHINTALREVYRLRPDAFIGHQNTGVLTNNQIQTYDVTDLNLVPATDFPLDDRLFYDAVVFYVAGRLELADDEYTEDSRARTLLAAFSQMLSGG